MNRFVQKPRRGAWSAAAIIAVVAGVALSAAADECEPAGLYGAVQVFDAGQTALEIAAGDLNGDGHDDLVTTNLFGDELRVLLSVGDGTFAPAQSVAVGRVPAGISIADVDNDGRLDLVTTPAADQSVNVLLGNGDGTFTAPQSYGVGRNPLAVVVSDFNGDGADDLAVANSQSDDISVLLGAGNGTFASEQRYGAGDYPQSIVPGDFNGDGHIDLGVVNRLGGDVSVLLGDGNGTFAVQQRFAVGRRPHDLAVGDLNDDGHLDIVATNNVDNSVSVLLGAGDGTLAPQQRYAVGTAPLGLAADDLDGDGIVDLTVMNHDDGDISVLTGVGDGTFAAQIRFPTVAAPQRVIIHDLNGDNAPDLALTSEANGVGVMLNQRGASRPIITNTTQSTTHCTLQEALDNAVSGDAITIGEGTLFEDNIVFPVGLDVTVTGAGMDRTFIDGGGEVNPMDPIMSIAGADLSATLSDLTLRNGYATGGAGGANVFGATADFTRVAFRSNTALQEADILVNNPGASVRLDGCEFYGSAGRFSIVLGDTTQLTAVNTLFHSLNLSDWILIATLGSTADLTNCTFAPENGLAVVAISDAHFNFANSIVLGTQYVDSGGVISLRHCLYPGAPSEDGNIDGTPTFVDPDNGDFRLAPGSLGIDAADYDAYTAATNAGLDLGGAWRRVDDIADDTGAGVFTYLDIGAYETAHLAGDCNSNGVDDARDLETVGAMTDFQRDAGHLFALNANHAGTPMVDSGSLRLTEGDRGLQAASAIADPRLEEPVEDFRVSFDAQLTRGPIGDGRDGFSFALLDKQVHDTSLLFTEFGPVNDALSVRVLDAEAQRVEIALSLDDVLASVAVPLDINDGNWHRFEITFIGGDISVDLVPWGQPRITLIESLSVPGFTPMEALYGFGARAVVQANTQRIDNVRFESLRSNDRNGNGLPDDCEEACPTDFDNNGVVNAADVGSFISQYFEDLAGGTLLTDFDNNGVVNAADVGAFLSAYFEDLADPLCSGG